MKETLLEIPAYEVSICTVDYIVIHTAYSLSGEFRVLMYHHHSLVGLANSYRSRRNVVKKYLFMRSASLTSNATTPKRIRRAKYSATFLNSKSVVYHLSTTLP
jgi:hypothetical protein